MVTVTSLLPWCIVLCYVVLCYGVYSPVTSQSVVPAGYGAGFLWEPQQLTVAPGDLVSWRWSPGQVSSGSVGFAVHQTSSQDTDEYQPGGFSSGDKTQQGR